MIVFKGMTHNLKGDLKQGELRREAGTVAINSAIGGIGVLNEINPADLNFFKNYLKMMGMLWYRKGQNAVVWDPRVIEMHGCAFRVVMTGGHVGADGVAGVGDDRRVGPNRLALKFKGSLRKHPDFRFQAVGIHRVAKKDTTAKWRRLIWRRSVRQTSRFINRSIKNYPNGFIAGDENSIALVDYPNLNDRAVKTPATHGRNRYDQVHVFGDLNVMDVAEHNTPSDHDMLSWKFVVKGAF